MRCQGDVDVVMVTLFEAYKQLLALVDHSLQVTLEFTDGRVMRSVVSVPSVCFHCGSDLDILYVQGS